jgi:hypothetical protein
MKGIEQRTGYKRVRPYHAWRYHEKSTGDPTRREANQLCGNDEEPLIWEQNVADAVHQSRDISREWDVQTSKTVALVIIHPLYGDDVGLKRNQFNAQGTFLHVHRLTA